MEKCEHVCGGVCERSGCVCPCGGIHERAIQEDLMDRLEKMKHTGSPDENGILVCGPDCPNPSHKEN